MTCPLYVERGESPDGRLWCRLCGPGGCGPWVGEARLAELVERMRAGNAEAVR